MRHSLKRKAFSEFVETAAKHLAEIPQTPEMDEFVIDLNVFMVNLLSIIKKTAVEEDPRMHLAALLAIGDLVAAFGEQVLVKNEKTIH